MKKQSAKLAKLLLLLALSPLTLARAEDKIMAEQTSQIPYIKLSAELFEKCLPWRDGKYITIDKKGRFATVEWQKNFGKDILTTKPLCNFPKQDSTPGYFSASPETGWIWTWDRMKLLCYNADTKLHSDFIPVMSWKGYVSYVTPLSQDELLLSFFWLKLGETDCIVNFPYNQRTQNLDISHDKDRSEVHLWKQLQPFGNDFLAFEYYDKMYNSKFFFYNKDTRKKIENDLTKTMTALFAETSEKEIYVDMNKKMILSKSRSSYPLVITWNDGYTDVKVYTAEHIFPDGKRTAAFTASPDSRWICVFLSGYRGLKGEFLNKVGFVQISDKYPGMFSPIVLINDEYTEWQRWTFNHFIEHPEYGTCFICSYDNGKTEETRLYKMSDAQKAIEAKIGEIAE